MKMPRWLTWTFIALLSWGIWAVLCKLLGNALSAEQSQALSTLGMLPIFVPLLLSKNVSLRDSPRKDLFLALMGGMVTCLGNVAYYAALGRGQKVATVVSLTALYPLVTILLAVILLRERLNGVQMGGIALSFVAIWMFNIQDGGGLLSPAIVYAVLPIVLWGLSGFLQKLATNRLSAETAALVYLSAFIPVGIFFAMRAPWPTTLTPRIWIVVLVLGFSWHSEISQSSLRLRMVEKRRSSLRSAVSTRLSASPSRSGCSMKESVHERSSRFFARSRQSRRSAGKVLPERMSFPTVDHGQLDQ
jgi:uncharacterized membrane protein